MTQGFTPEQQSAIHLNTELGPGTLDEALAQVANVSLPLFLPTMRWFGHKQRRIIATRILDRTVVAEERNLFALCLVRVEFELGADADYFIPLAFTGEPVDPPAILAPVIARNGQWNVADAPALPAFRQWLASDLVCQNVREGLVGQFSWVRPSSSTATIEIFDLADSRVVSAEQSNTSIIYGQAAMLKMFRRVEPGPNPDAELGRFLSSRTNFSNVPSFLGELRYSDASGEVRSLALAQGYVANAGDGWSYTLASLAAEARTESAHTMDLDADARLLGLRTAQMHIALASDPLDDTVRPEPIIVPDVEIWSRALATSLDRVSSALHLAAGSLTGSDAELVRAFKQALRGFYSRSSGLKLLLGRSKIRVHGDYHLGQTLRTLDNDFVILDFEGEPRRSIAERRAKNTPLKDVAGMLRSFGYARGTVERDYARADAVALERAARDAFLSAYFDEVHAANASLLPDTREDFREALIPWELDKALYEIEYELNNRPDWLWLPLTATLKMV